MSDCDKDVSEIGRSFCSIGIFCYGTSLFLSLYVYILIGIVKKKKSKTKLTWSVVKWKSNTDILSFNVNFSYYKDATGFSKNKKEKLIYFRECKIEEKERDAAVVTTVFISSFIPNCRIRSLTSDLVCKHTKGWQPVRCSHYNLFSLVSHSFIL